MFNSLETTIPYLFTLVILSFLSSYLLYVAILKSNKNKWSVLFIPAEKSPTNARLLGGLGTAVSIFTTVSFMLSVNQYSNFLNLADQKLLYTSVISIAMLTIAGYIDDRFELRARYKLFFQVISVASFSYASTLVFASNHSLIIFSCSLFLGLALINGTNLLDGLDSMSLKIGSVISIGFLFLGLKTQSAILISLSLITLSSLGSFYFFGKEPARIYMGEIGGSLLGFLFYIQAIFAYGKLSTFNHAIDAASWVFLICALPVLELAISFTRRVVMNKSPFRGDKLHLHHILKMKFKLTATTTSDIIASGLFLINFFGAFLSYLAGPKIGGLAVVFIFTGCYLKICLNDWRKIQKSSSEKNLFLYFEDKPVFVVNSDLFKHVQVQQRAKAEKNKQKKSAA